MTWLLYDIPLMVLFSALWVGIPLRLVARRPDTGPQAAQMPAIAHLPPSRTTLATSALPDPRRGRVRARLGTLIVNRRRLPGGAD